MNTFNAAALLNQDLTTIAGRFAKLKVDGEYESVSQTYGWFCTHALAKILVPGDIVVVESRDLFQLVLVEEVHDDAQIDLDATFEYSLAIQKVRTAEFYRLREGVRNSAKLLDRRRVQNLRAQVAAQFGVSSLTFDKATPDTGDGDNQL